MSHSGNEELKEQAFNDVVEQYIEKGYTEEEAIALANKFKEDNSDFWIKEEPYNYNAQWRS
tara:strand:+ start:660 stop:842 length:183 start_codon:yes stop_codon:yes gene_type:complete